MTTKCACKTERMLFISTTFNGYYQEIIENLKNSYLVDWYSDRPSNSIFSRAIIRVCPKLMKLKIAKYEQRILKEIGNKRYDVIFVILGQSFSQKFWAELRKSQANAAFIYYLWDSSTNFKCISNNYKFFDITFSFDKNDCQKYGFEFLPLFYTKQFNVDSPNPNPNFDYSYIGTVKPGRYMIVNRILKQLDTQNLKGFKYFYLHSKYVLLYYKIKYKKEFNEVKIGDLNFKLLSREKCFELENNSKIIVDVQQPGQLGLTIRTFEALGMKKKIITTNSDIRNYDFFNENNIYIVNGDTIDFENSFFKTEFKEIDEKIREKYSIKNWTATLIDAAYQLRKYNTKKEGA